MLILGGGSIDTQLGKDPAKTLEGSPLTMLILGGVNQHSTWKGSATDFGRIASDNVDPGGSIDTPLGKDPQQLGMINL